MGTNLERIEEMGTNYYLVKNGPTKVAPVHIGKSSLGWMFLFQSHSDGCFDHRVNWQTYPQVKDVLKKLTVDSDEYVIMDEYDEVVPYDDFIKLVEWKQHDPWSRDNPDNFSNANDVGGYRFTDREFS